MKSFLAGTTTGRVIVLATVVIGAASAVHFYLIDLPKMEEEAKGPQAAERLEEMSDAFDEATSKDEAMAARLVSPSGWNPASLSCQSGAKTVSEGAEVWKVLGLEDGLETVYQFRYARNDNGRVTLHARRDRDCDGLFEVYERHQTAVGWSGSAANVGE